MFVLLFIFFFFCTFELSYRLPGDDVVHGGLVRHLLRHLERRVLPLVQLPVPSSPPVGALAVAAAVAGRAAAAALSQVGLHGKHEKTYKEYF